MTTEFNREKAISLITPVIDDEATSMERNAFFSYINRDEKVYRMYLSEKNVKDILQKNINSTKAPDRLYDFVKNVDDYFGYVDIPDSNNFDVKRNIISKVNCLNTTI